MSDATPLNYIAGFQDNDGQALEQIPEEAVASLGEPAGEENTHRTSLNDIRAYALAQADALERKA